VFAILFLSIQGVTVTLDRNEFIYNENRGPVNITLSLDQPSCRPITIVARPRVRPTPSATSNIIPSTYYQ